MDDIVASLHDAYMLVGSVQPLTPNASPATAAVHRKDLCRINQYIGQMTAHVQGVAAASQADDASDGENGGIHDGSGEWGKLYSSHQVVDPRI